jgi:tetratricopeptide (TPR) repeat protein
VVGLLAAPLGTALLGAGVLLGLAALRWRVVGRPLPASPLLLPFALYLGGAVLGLLVAVAPTAGWVRLCGLLAAFGVFFLMLEFVHSDLAAQRAVTLALVLVLLAVPVVFLLSLPVMLDRLPPLAQDSGVLPTLRQLREMAFTIDPLIQARYRLTPSGIGMLALWGMGLAFGPLLTGAQGRLRLLSMFALAELGLFVVLSGSREAMLGVPLIALLLGSIRRRWLLVLALLEAAAIGVALSGLVDLGSTYQAAPTRGLVQRFTASVATVRARQEIWTNVLFLMQDFRFTGVGLGPLEAQAVVDRHFSPSRIAHAHNIFVHSYLEQGVLGLVGLAGIIGVALVVSVRALRRRPSAAVISASGALLGLTWSGLTEIPPLTTGGMVLLGGSLALLIVARRMDDPSLILPSPAPPTSRVSRARRWAVTVAGPPLLALLLLLLVVGMPPATRGPSGAGAGALLADPLGPPRAIAAALWRNLGAVEANKALQTGPDRPDERDRHVAAARRHLVRALALEPGNAAAYRYLSEVALAVGEQDQAQILLVQAEQRTAAGDSQAFLELGRLYRAAGDVDRAVAAWSRVDPSLGAWSRTDRGTQLVMWGQQLMRRAQWRDAVTVNRAAIEAVPIAPEPYDALVGAALRVEGEPATLRTMQALATAHPHVPWPYEQVAALHRRSGREQLADEWERRARAARESDAWALEQERALITRGYPARVDR